VHISFLSPHILLDEPVKNLEMNNSGINLAHRVVSVT